MCHEPSPTLQPPSSRPLERWPASGEAQVNLWAALICCAARPANSGHSTQPPLLKLMRLRIPGPGIPSDPCTRGRDCLHADAATETPQSHSRSNKNEVGAVTSCVHSTPSIVSSKWGLDASGVIFRRPSAPPGGPGRRSSRPPKTWGGRGLGREAMLTWLGWAEHHAVQHTTLSASSGPTFVGLTFLCCGAPSFPDRAPQDGKGTHLEAASPAPPPPSKIHSLGSICQAGF